MPKSHYHMVAELKSDLSGVSPRSPITVGDMDIHALAKTEKWLVKVLEWLTDQTGRETVPTEPFGTTTITCIASKDGAAFTSSTFVWASMTETANTAVWDQIHKKLKV